MTKKITLKKAERVEVLDFITRDERNKAEAKKLKDEKPRVAGIIHQTGKLYKVDGKTRYYATIYQENGQRKALILKETDRMTLGWKAYALSLGGTEEGAKAFAETSTTLTIARATPTQLLELGLEP